MPGVETDVLFSRDEDPPNGFPHTPFLYPPHILNSYRVNDKKEEEIKEGEEQKEKQCQ